MRLNHFRSDFFFLVTGSLLLGSGCASQSEPDAPTGNPSAAHRSDSSRSKQQVPITLAETDHAGLQTWLAHQRGKVVVLDIWATWCPPCIKGLSDLVALHHRANPAQLVCVSLCCDFQGLQAFPVVKSKALAFLKRRQADCANFISTVESDDLFQQLGIASIPVVEVYAADGQLARRFDLSTGQEFSYDDVQQVIDRLLDRR